MYPGPSSRKFGSKVTNVIGGGHKIAQFETSVNGAAAMFDLLARVYVDLTVQAAITKWSGGNNVPSYLTVLRNHGVESSVKLSRAYLESPATAIPFAKAMAEHETGRPYPMTESEWVAAHALAFPVRTAVVVDGVEVALDSSPRTSNGDHMVLARSLIGTKEFPGTGPGQDNPIIMRWFYDVGFDVGEAFGFDGRIPGAEKVRNDETPNCAVFTGAVLKATGCAYVHGVGAALAMSYRTVGDPTANNLPEYGCIGVMRRGTQSWQGHVGFVVDWTSDTITLLGANQNDQVCIETYPRDKFVAFRRPVPAQKGVVETAVASQSVQLKSAGLFASVMTLLTMIYDWGSAMVEWAGTHLGYWLGVLPEIATRVKTTVGASQELYSSIGLKMAMTTSTTIAVGIIAWSIWQSIKNERNQTLVTGSQLPVNQVPA